MILAYQTIEGPKRTPPGINSGGKKENGHKRIRTILGPRRLNKIIGCNQKVGRLYVALYDLVVAHELQGRHKLPN